MMYILTIVFVISGHNHQLVSFERSQDECVAKAEVISLTVAPTVDEIFFYCDPVE